MTKTKDVPAGLLQPGVAEAVYFDFLDTELDRLEPKLFKIATQAANNLTARKDIKKYDRSRAEDLLKRIDPDGITTLSKAIRVEGYEREDGTKVSAHTRGGKPSSGGSSIESQVGERFSVRGPKDATLERADRAGFDFLLGPNDRSERPQAQGRAKDQYDFIDSAFRIGSQRGLTDEVTATRGEAANAWAREIDRIAGQDNEVRRLIDGMRLGTHQFMDHNSKGYQRANFVADMLDVIGVDRVQKGWNGLRGNLGSGGRIDGDELAILGDEFRDNAAVSRGARITGISDWLKGSNTRRSKFLEALDGQEPGMGFVIDPKSGDVEYGYRGQSLSSDKGDRFSPLSIRGLFGSRDKDVVRSRAKGGLTNSDVFWGAVMGQKSVTTVSGDGIMSAQFNFGQMGIWDRFKMYRKFKGLNKAADKVSSNEGVGPESFGRTVNIMGLVKDEYPRTIKFSTEGFKPRESKTPYFDAVRDLSTRLGKLNDDQVYGAESMRYIEREVKAHETKLTNMGFEPREIAQRKTQIREEIAHDFMKRLMQPERFTGRSDRFNEGQFSRTVRTGAPLTGFADRPTPPSPRERTPAGRTVVRDDDGLVAWTEPSFEELERGQGRD